MAGVNGEGLRYYPAGEYPTKGLDLATPMKAYMDHQKDLQVQKLAEQTMAMRRQAQDEEMRRGQVADQQRAVGMQREEAHTNRRDELYAKQEDRRQGEVLFNRQKLTSAEHEQLIHDLYFPPGTPGTPEYIARQQYAAAALQRAGYMPPEPITEDDSPPVAPPQAGEAPVVVKDPTLGGTIEATDGRAMGHVKPPSAADKALNSQLDSIDQKYSKGLGAPAAPKKYLPGKSSVARSDAMLSTDDPYSKL